ncbi:hypothetical protein KESI111651_14030 [Kerstersia similis]
MKNRAKVAGESLEALPEPRSRPNWQTLCFRAGKRLAKPIERPVFSSFQCLEYRSRWHHYRTRMAMKNGHEPPSSCRLYRSSPCRQYNASPKPGVTGPFSAVGDAAALHASAGVCEYALAASGDKPGPGAWSMPSSRSQNHAIGLARACHRWLRLGKGRRMIVHAPAPSLLPPGDRSRPPGGCAFSYRAFPSTGY